MSVPKPMLAAWKMMIDSIIADIYPVSLIHRTCQFLSMHTVAPKRMMSSDPHGGLRNVRTYTRISRQTSEITKHMAAVMIIIPA